MNYDTSLSLIKEKWEEIKEDAKHQNEIIDLVYDTWIKPLVPYLICLKNGKDTLVIFFPDAKDYMVDYVNTKYKLFLRVSIEKITGLDMELEFSNLESQENTITITEKHYNLSVMNANLNPKYTFDTFVVGANNKFAHAASLAVAESPAERYNPLFIYGGVGLGKTHLMHSIAHYILMNNPKAKVLYITSEQFTNELIDSIRDKSNNATSEFRNKYRNIDVLLIDDIQFIADKESTQEEFFHTFNHLHEAKKQIVISSDKPPKNLTTLAERLRSRFEMGLTVDISAPDYETRMAILRKKEEMDGYNIDNEVIKYIAEHIKTNIREIEGALTKIIAYSRLNNMEITLELAQEALKDLIYPDAKKEITPEYIIKVVAAHFEISVDEITSKSRSQNVAYPRQIAMYLCKTMTSLTLMNIGKYFGGKDHTTIIHAVNKISSDIKTSESTASTIDVLKKKLNPI